MDRGLKPILAGKPLMLMGVHEEVAAYRRAARYANILTIESLGNPDCLTTSDIAARAADACRAYTEQLAEQVLADYQEMPDRVRTLGDVPAILRAASEGRVHRLCVRSGAEVPVPNGEDVVNAAVVETLRAGGEVFMVPEDKMPAAQPMAAIPLPVLVG